MRKLPHGDYALKRLRPNLRLRYALAALTLFGLEVAIALFAHDQFLRPFVGDVLVVVLIYCAVQTLILRPPARVALGVLLFACTIEALQGVDYARWLGADRIGWISVVLGRTFSWDDFLAYFCGYALTRLDRNEVVAGSADGVQDLSGRTNSKV